MDLKLQDQHILITGSAGGIGLETVKAFLNHGCKVSCHYNSECSSLNDTLQSFPDRCFVVKADAKREEDVIKAVGSAVEKFGPINVLVANHGTFASEEVPISEMSLTQWRTTIDTNLTGTFLFVREYLKQLKDFKNKSTKETITTFNAAVVIIGSTAGKFGEAYHADYASTKSALMYGFLKSLKNEIVQIIPNGRANSVAPGWVYTKMAEESVKLGHHLKALQTMPLKKIASVQDVSNAILLLSSQVTYHTTGSIIEVDGGMEGQLN